MSLRDAVELANSYSRPCEECAEWRARAEAAERREALRNDVEPPINAPDACTVALEWLDWARPRAQQCAEYRAQVESLSVALDESVVAARNLLNGLDEKYHRPVVLRSHPAPCAPTLDFCVVHDAERRLKMAENVLARLPAAALAERRALEACAVALRNIKIPLIRQALPIIAERDAALAALYAARGEGGT